MKDSPLLLAAAAAAIFLIPMTARLLDAPAQPHALPAAASAEPAAESAAESAAPYRILETASGTVQEVSVRSYLIGAVAAEMPASYEPEALKAQAVAVHTYAERIRRQQAQSPDPALCGADFSDDAHRYQGYCTAEQLRLLWGDAYDENYSKIAAAVDSVSDLLLYYGDEPIAAAFHAVSAGQTESAEHVWGEAVPYLVPVSSAGDRSAPHFEETAVLSADTVRSGILAAYPAAALPADPAEWFSTEAVSDSGTVLRIRAGSAVLTGQQLRTALGLRSACFTVGYSSGNFLFTVKGSGHAVGMSQYGANVMAQSGASFDDILLHYYSGAELRKTA